MLEIQSTDTSSQIEQEINDLKNLVAPLEITGVDDRKGYKQVLELAKQVRSRRLEIQKNVKEIDSKIAQIRKDFNQNSRLIIDEFSEIETGLRQKLQVIDDEKEMIKQAEKAAKLQRYTDRTQQLFDTGFVFNGVIYSLGTLMATSEAINDWDDDAFGALLADGAKMKAEIDEREAEKEELLSQLKGIRAKERMIIDEADGVESFGDPLKIGKSFAQTHLEDRSSRFWEENSGSMGEWPEQDLSKLPFDVNIGFVQTMPAEPEKSIPKYPAGYTMGFDAARNKVLEILNGTEKMTREELKSKIIDLEY
jgi:hypothetical protein